MNTMTARISAGTSGVKAADELTADQRPTFRRPTIVIPVPTPSLKFQKVEAGVPDTQLAREATGLLHEFSTRLLFNHSHRVYFWANDLGQQTGQKFDVGATFYLRGISRSRFAGAIQQCC